MDKLKTAIFQAQEAWKLAPTHIRLMAGNYVVPLLASLEAIREHLEAMTGTNEALEQLEASSAENYLRGRYGAYRGHFAWRDIEEAYNAGFEDNKPTAKIEGKK